VNEIETQIDKLFEGIPQSRRKEEIKQEITQNLNEKVSDLVLKGHSREQAVKMAIDDFGDIEDLKQELAGSAKYDKSKKIGLSLAFSIWGAILISALFIFINFYYTPNVIWFVYPVFAVIWWPMTIFFHWFHNKNDMPVGFAYSVCNFILIAGLMVFINMYYTPDIIWFVYPIFGVIWWPLAMLFCSMRRKSRKDD
jgi:hypothetical protein